MRGISIPGGSGHFPTGCGLSMISKLHVMAIDIKIKKALTFSRYSVFFFIVLNRGFQIIGGSLTGDGLFIVLSFQEPGCFSKRPDKIQLDHSHAAEHPIR